MKKNAYILLIITCCFFVLKPVLAEERIDYKSQPVVDSDLDGLTDEGEKQVYHTDPNNPDTDGDGVLDGAETVGKTDPLDVGSPQSKQVVTNYVHPVNMEPAWPWYIVRAAGLMAFLLLYLSIFFGIAIRFPILRRILNPADSLDVHRWISVQALAFVLIHALGTLWDKYVNFSLRDIFIPFASSYDPGMIALGTIGMYLMVALIATSYLRRFISQNFWRAIHSLNFFLYAFVFAHAIYLGTDLKSGIARDIFIYANAALLILLVISISIRIIDSIRNKKIIFHKNDENLRQN